MLILIIPSAKSGEIARSQLTQLSNYLLSNSLAMSSPDRLQTAHKIAVLTEDSKDLDVIKGVVERYRSGTLLCITGSDMLLDDQNPRTVQELVKRWRGISVPGSILCIHLPTLQKCQDACEELIDCVYRGDYSSGYGAYDYGLPQIIEEIVD